MAKYYFFLIVLISSVLLSEPSFAAAVVNNRDQMIEKRLNCAAQAFDQKKDFAWADVCYTDVPQQDNEQRQKIIEHDLQAASRYKDNLKRQEYPLNNLPDQTQPAQVQDAGQEQEDNQAVVNTDVINSGEEKPNEAYKELKKSRHRFELGTEAYGYRYTERIGVKTTGTKGGLIGAYEYRFNDNPLLDVSEKFNNDVWGPNLFRLEGRMSYGQVKYEGSGSWNQIPDWNFEARGLLGVEIPFSNGLTLMPYGGAGYRYLLNEFSVVPARIINGQEYYSGYDRESFYVYIPLGLETKNKITESWSLTSKAEYDWFIYGHQNSHLEDSVDLAGVPSGADTIGNRQTKGMGWRASLRLTKEAEHCNFFFEPFIRFWHIEDSTIEKGALEPDNKTTEFGFNIGANF